MQRDRDKVAAIEMAEIHYPHQHYPSPRGTSDALQGKTSHGRPCLRNRVGTVALLGGTVQIPFGKEDVS